MRFGRAAAAAAASTTPQAAAPTSRSAEETSATAERLHPDPGDRVGSDPAGEHAAAEEGPLERALAVQPTAAEPGGLADRVEAGDRLPVLAQYPRAQVGLDAAERLPRHHRHADGDQGASLRVLELLELRGPQAV